MKKIEELKQKIPELDEVYKIIDTLHPYKKQQLLEIIVQKLEIIIKDIDSGIKIKNFQNINKVYNKIKEEYRKTTFNIYELLNYIYEQKLEFNDMKGFIIMIYTILIELKESEEVSFVEKEKIEEMIVIYNRLDRSSRLTFLHNLESKLKNIYSWFFSILEKTKLNKKIKNIKDNPDDSFNFRDLLYYINYTLEDNIYDIKLCLKVINKELTDVELYKKYEEAKHVYEDMDSAFKKSFGIYREILAKEKGQENQEETIKAKTAVDRAKTMLKEATEKKNLIEKDMTEKDIIKVDIFGLNDHKLENEYVTNLGLMDIAQARKKRDEGLKKIEEEFKRHTEIIAVKIISKAIDDYNKLIKQKESGEEINKEEVDKAFTKLYKFNEAYEKYKELIKQKKSGEEIDEALNEIFNLNKKYER